MSDHKKHHYVPKFLLRQFSGDRKNMIPIIEEGPVIQRADGKMSQTIYNHIEKLNLRSKFSFVRVIDNKDYAGFRALPVRSKELMETLQQQKNHIAVVSKKRNSL